MGGVYYLVDAFGWWWEYFWASGSPTRHEHLIGVFFSAVRALPFWVFVSLFAFPARKAVSRRANFAIHAPAAMLALGLFLVNSVPLIAFGAG